MSLRSKVIRLAASKPELRPTLLPILVKAGRESALDIYVADPSPENAKALVDGGVRQLNMAAKKKKYGRKDIVEILKSEKDRLVQARVTPDQAGLRSYLGFRPSMKWYRLTPEMREAVFMVVVGRGALGTPTPVRSPQPSRSRVEGLDLDKVMKIISDYQKSPSLENAAEMSDFGIRSFREMGSAGGFGQNELSSILKDEEKKILHGGLTPSFVDVKKYVNEPTDYGTGTRFLNRSMKFGIFLYVLGKHLYQEGAPSVGGAQTPSSVSPPSSARSKRPTESVRGWQDQLKKIEEDPSYDNLYETEKFGSRVIGGAAEGLGLSRADLRKLFQEEKDRINAANLPATVEGFKKYRSMNRAGSEFALNAVMRIGIFLWLAGRRDIGFTQRKAPQGVKHLQGIGKVPAIQAKDLEPGMVTIWNYGGKEKIKSVEQRGKTVYLEVLVKDMDGNVQTMERKMRTTTMVGFDPREIF